MNIPNEAIDETTLAALARALAATTPDGLVIHLHGDLGAGKTTFARAFLQALGAGERVKSPTYSLIESYDLGDRDAHHLDLYRLADPEEMQWLGLPDLLDDHTLLLVEWPERGGEWVPGADIVVTLAHAGDRRRVDIRATSERGKAGVAMLSDT